MRLVLKLLAFFVLGLLAVSCSNAKLDTSDAKSFSESIKNMYDNATAKDKSDFKNFFYIAMNGRSDLITMSVLDEKEISRLDSFFRVLSTKKKPEELAALNGLSISEIVDLGRNLKITYLDGRIQHIQKEIGSLENMANFYQTYRTERDKVTIEVPKEAISTEGTPGKVGSIEIPLLVKNDSDLPLVDLQKKDYGEPWVVEIHLGDESKLISLNGNNLKNENGEPVFKHGGIPPGQSKIIRIIDDVSDLNWAYPTEEPIMVVFPEGFEPCLDGWEGSFEAEDSFKRVTELERQYSILTKELNLTKA
jgi:hypothetical protein